MNIEQCKPKMQIVYIPYHAREYRYHPDFEYGFIVNTRGNIVFCRFWTKKSNPDNPELRTLANSQGCRVEDIEPFYWTDQKNVELAWNEYVEAY